VAQIGKILLTDPQHLEVRWNGEWLGAMNLIDIIKLASRKSVAQMLDRDSFKERFQSGGDIRIHEFLYPLLQGWDSVIVQADVEMGGSDQLFNNLVGREFMKEEGQDPQVVMVTPLLVGTDGVAKMSKSKGNYIGLTDSPGGAEGIFGKVMRVPDSLLENYYTLLTDEPREQFEALIRSKPRDAKAGLAKKLVSWLHGTEAAEAAEREFVTATHGGIPEQIAEFGIPAGAHKLPALLVQSGLAASNSEAMRKIREGAVRIDGEKFTDPQKEYLFEKAAVVQLGSRKFARLVPRS
jgi:tyrosyl-tRNA synthetase